MKMENKKNISVIGSRCTGCAACAEICVTKCIYMETDEEGFGIPVIDELNCINCGKCLKVCPSNSTIELRYPKKAYSAASNDEKGSFLSSSGGVFYEAARYMIQQLGGYVCGAVLNEHLQLRHIVTNSMSDIPMMQGSKYIQSDIRECYPVIRKLIQEKKYVLFSGTPCQIAGINQIVGDSEYIITMDLICHGVPSNQMFTEYMNRFYPEDRYLNFSFRQKNIHTKSVFAYSYQTLKDEKRNSWVFSFQDPFYQAFLRGDSYRESCYQCKYACNQRAGDITIGDCANNKAYKELLEKELSTICVNTEKGQLLWDKIQDRFTFVEADYIQETKQNAQLHRPSSKTALRNQFYVDLCKLSFRELKRKYCPKRGLKAKITHFILYHTTPRQRSEIKKLITKS